MTRAFWDSSVLMPLCLNEATTPGCEALRLRFGCVVWWATFVEIRSGIARAVRGGRLNTAQRIESLSRLLELQSGWVEVVPNNDLRMLAGDILDRYDLRAADSLQLAAALVWCSQRPAGRVFICSDLRLGEAAELAGFTVVRP